jgi:hypothetical protein
MENGQEGYSRPSDAVPCRDSHSSTRPAPFGGWEAAGDAFDVGEDAITLLAVQALKRVVQMTFVRFGRTIVIVRSERPVGRRQRFLPGTMPAHKCLLPTLPRVGCLACHLADTSRSSISIFPDRRSTVAHHAERFALVSVIICMTLGYGRAPPEAAHIWPTSGSLSGNLRLFRCNYQRGGLPSSP